MAKYKNSIYYNDQRFPHITLKEYGMMLDVFNVISSIYNRYKPKGRKSFLNYFFVLKKILIMLGKIKYTKYILSLKIHSQQKELEQIWNQITNDPERVVALQKQKNV